uniref:Uncharacterized protein n=1 Tax=Stomoxys calcitrans TaxID=35570 RepID=A0A1I8PJK3_STOCA
MGKAQSKRSVDITTDGNKCADSNIHEKMEKIDVENGSNGELALPINYQADNCEHVEHNKDAKPEKIVESESPEQSTNYVKTSPEYENQNDSPKETVALADENSMKKSKKEKVKKKWSFRNISFGKKDKQKPGKSEDTPEKASTMVNGTDANTLLDAEESEKQRESTNGTENEVVELKCNENGNVSECKVNVQQNEETLDNKKEEIDRGSHNNIEDNVNGTKYMPEVLSTESNTNEILTVTKSSEEMVLKEDTSTEFDSVKEAAENNILSDVKPEAISLNGNVDDVNQNMSLLDDENSHNEVKINTENYQAETLDVFSNCTSNPSNVPVNAQNVKTSDTTKPDVESDTSDQISSKSHEHDNKTIVDDKLGNGSSPPPLPISPPPSHVAVFAFINNDESTNKAMEKNADIATQMENVTEEIMFSADSVNLTDKSDVNETSPQELILSNEPPVSAGIKTDGEDNKETDSQLLYTDRYKENDNIKEVTINDDGRSKEFDCSANEVNYIGREKTVVENHTENSLNTSLFRESTTKEEDVEIPEECNLTTTLSPSKVSPESCTEFVIKNVYSECIIAPKSTSGEEYKTDDLKKEEIKANALESMDTITHSEVKQDPSVESE